MSRPAVRAGRRGRFHRGHTLDAAGRWYRVSIRHRILVAMLAVSVIPLAIVSLTGLGALSWLNSGALKTANSQLESSQDAHLNDLVHSKALLINNELQSVQNEVALLSQATGAALAQPPAQPPPSSEAAGISLYGPGGSAAEPSPQVLALRSLGSQLALVYNLHPEVADVWVQLPQQGLTAVAPTWAITRSPGVTVSDLSPPLPDYQAGVQRLTSDLDSRRWRSLLPQLSQSVVWTPVYDNPAAGGETVTVATETDSSSGIPFWVGANITVKTLVSTFLSGSPGHSEGGYSFLVSSDGTVLSYSPSAAADLGVATRKQRQAATINLVSANSPWLTVGNSMRTGFAGEQTVNLAGDVVEVFYSPLAASQWSLGVGVPVSGIDGSVVGFSQTITRGLVGVTALLLPVLVVLAFLVAILARVISGRLIRPLSGLTDASRRISGGDLDTPVALSPVPTDEIGGLESALERMRQRLAGQRQLIDASQRLLEQRVEARTAELRDRNEELAILNSVSADLSRSLVLADVASGAADRLRQLWNVSEVSVYLSDGTAAQGVRLVGQAVRGEPVGAGAAELGLALRQAEVSSETPVKVGDLVVVPLLVTGARVGYLVLRQDEVPSSRQVEMLEVLAGQLALALRNAQLFADTEEMATVNERNRIAREIHDTLAQGLAGIVVQLQAAEAWLSREPGRAQGALAQATDLARSSLQEARRSVWDLRPEALQRNDLAAAIREELERLCERPDVEGQLELLGVLRRPSPQAEVAAFRIFMEAAANALNHGHPAHLRVRLSSPGQRFRLEVHDDGSGFDPSGPTRAGSFGITSMRERASSCGGHLEVHSLPGRGTRVVLEVPSPVPETAPVAP